MGSMVSRAALAKYSYLYDGAVLLGTVNTRLPLDAGIVLTRTICRLKGGFYRSKTLDRLLLNLSNAKIENPVNEYAWVSRDEQVSKAYAEDPLCNFHFTARAYSDLIFLLSYVSQKDWARKIGKLLPVLICGGSDDPVGNYGKGIRQVEKRLKKCFTCR